LQRQRLVEHEATRAGKAAHLTLLFAVGHELILEGTGGRMVAADDAWTCSR
jgi:hypothetical protein